MNNIPPVPGQGNYRALKLISSIMNGMGWTNVILSIPAAVLTFIIFHLVISSLLNSVNMGHPIAEINTTSMLMATGPSLTVLVIMGFIGIILLAGGESIRLMIDLRDDQYYANRILYLITSRIYERNK